MKSKFLFVIFSIFGIILVSSCEEPKARKPVSRATGTFLKESVKRNRKMVTQEEKIIDSIIKSNPDIKYNQSQMGYWYTYDVKNDKDTLRPKIGDKVYFEYEVFDLFDNIIYTKLELRPQEYIIDKQKLMTGLRDGLKLMRKKETVTFLFPSHIAYGYYGDKNRIGTNIPLKCIVTLNEIEPQNRKINNSNNETND